MIGPPTSSRRRLERGEITWVGAVLLVAVLAAGYLASMWGPVYLVHLDAKQATRGSINDAVREKDDRLLLDRLCRKLAALGDEDVVDAQGRLSRAPMVDVRPQDVTWERLEGSPPRLHAAFEYVRVVRYPWTDRFSEKTFSVDVTQDIDVPRW